jgi:hypothetical protein
MNRALLCCALLMLPLPVLATARSWTFRVFLDNREVGEHRYTLSSFGNQLMVRSLARYDVRVLLVNVFRYRHSATEIWQGDCLRSLQSDTETNGQQQQVRAEYTECIMSFAYWKPEILRAHQLLNSQTGVLTPVNIAMLGSESISVRGQTSAATHYRMTGPQLAIDLWYVDNEWVALESATDNGHRLRYHLL